MVSTARPPQPSSCTVGMSGANEARSRLVTARIRILPASTSGRTIAAEVEQEVDLVAGQRGCGLHDILERDFLDLQAARLDEIIEREIRHAGRAGDIEFARPRHRFGDELAERLDWRGGRHIDGQHRVGDLRDRRHVAREIVGQFVERVGMRHERGARRIEQGVVVIGLQEGIDRQQPVGAGLVLDHDRLAPFGLQLVGHQAGGDVGGAAGSEGQDEFHRPLRPGRQSGRWRAAWPASGGRATPKFQARPFSDIVVNVPAWFPANVTIAPAFFRFFSLSGIVSGDSTSSQFRTCRSVAGSRDYRA